MAKFDPFLSLDCARVKGVGAQSKERKGSNFAAQRSGVIVQKPKGPNTYDLKFGYSNLATMPAGRTIAARTLSPRPAAAGFAQSCGCHRESRHPEDGESTCV